MPDQPESDDFEAFKADLMWALDAVEEDRKAVRDGVRLPPGQRTP